MELRKGQKIPLNENFLTIKFERNNSSVEIDTAAFLQEYGGKVGSDEDFVFYGNTSHNSDSVHHLADDSLDIDLSKIPTPRRLRILIHQNFLTVCHSSEINHNRAKPPLPAVTNQEA